MNRFLEEIGLSSLTQLWLADPQLVLYCLIAINIWQWTGFSFILYFANLSLIDEEIYEAAAIDGCNYWKKLTRITVPLLRNAHSSLIILGVIGSFKFFDIVFLTTGGGPGRVTEFLATLIYKKAIIEYKAGYASALSVFLLLIALTLTVAQLQLAKRSR